MDANEIRGIIESSPLADRVDDIMKLVRPALKLHAERVDVAILPLGASRMAGPADLPEGMLWPMNGDRPIELIAQINLADAAEVFLPPGVPVSGWLVFFADVEALNTAERAGSRLCHVAYFESNADDLKRVEQPVDPFYELHACTVGFEREDCLPTVFDVVREFGPPDEHRAQGFWDFIKRLVGKTPQPKRNASKDAWTYLDGRLEAWENRPFHRIGGYGMLVQSYQSDVEGLDLLLQVDSDEDGPDWMWGDAGRLYFWIDPKDLRKQAFGEVFLDQEFH